MQLLTNAVRMKWNWDGWFMGLFGALTSGAAQGLTALAIGIDWKKALILVGISTLVSIGKYLQTKPTPEAASETPRV
jgi:hypothetical protein